MEPAERLAEAGVVDYQPRLPVLALSARQLTAMTVASIDRVTVVGVSVGLVLVNPYIPPLNSNANENSVTW